MTSPLDDALARQSAAESVIPGAAPQDPELDALFNDFVQRATHAKLPLEEIREVVYKFVTEKRSRGLFRAPTLASRKVLDGTEVTGRAWLLPGCRRSVVLVHRDGDSRTGPCQDIVGSDNLGVLPDGTWGRVRVNHLGQATAFTPSQSRSRYELVCEWFDYAVASQLEKREYDLALRGQYMNVQQRSALRNELRHEFAGSRLIPELADAMAALLSSSPRS